MDSMTLFIASLAVSCIGALASVLLIKADNAAKTAGCLIGAVAAVLSFIAGLEAVLGDVSSLNTVFFFPFARLELLAQRPCGPDRGRSSQSSPLRASSTVCPTSMSTRARSGAPVSS